MSIVLLAVSLALSFVVTTDIGISVTDRDAKAAMYLAEIGLKQGEAALLESFFHNQWDDDLDPDGTFGRPTHVGDQLPTNLVDRSLTRNGMVLYRWDTTAAPPVPASAFWRVPMTVRGGNARYTVWVRNNADDYGGTVTTDLDSVVKLVSLGEILDGNGQVKARSFLTETVEMPAPVAGNYSQKGLGSGGTSTIEQ
jgi:hypothetical protein